MIDNKVERSRELHLKAFDETSAKILKLNSRFQILSRKQRMWLGGVRLSMTVAVHGAGLHEKALQASQLLGWMITELRGQARRLKEIGGVIDMSGEYVRIMDVNERGRRKNILAQQAVGIFERRPWERE